MRDWQPVFGLPLWVWLFVFPALLGLSCLLLPGPARRLLAPLWRLLDRLYLLSGIIASVFMLLILLLIVAQMIARWSGVAFPGSTEYAGYAMAATSFFALAYALMNGSHIRVSIFLNMNRHTRFWLDAVATLIAAVTATYFARYAIKANIMSVILNDRTQGQDYMPEWLIALLSMPAHPPSQWGRIWAEAGSGWVYTPIWVPQLAMSVGTVLLAIALWDALTRLLATGETAIIGEAVE